MTGISVVYYSAATRPFDPQHQRPLVFVPDLFSALFVALSFPDKGTSGTQIDVRSGDLSIAHIGKEMFSQLAGGGPRWRWYFKTHSGPPGFAHDGEADTFEAAKAQVERNWQAWLMAAGLSEGT